LSCLSRIGIHDKGDAGHSACQLVSFGMIDGWVTSLLAGTETQLGRAEAHNKIINM